MNRDVWGQQQTQRVLVDLLQRTTGKERKLILLLLYVIYVM